MNYGVRISRSASAYIRRLDARTQARLLSRLEQLATDPFAAAHSKPLAGPEGLRSARVGGLRVLFVVDVDERIVRVAAIGPRGQIYRDL